MGEMTCPPSPSLPSPSLSGGTGEGAAETPGHYGREQPKDSRSTEETGRVSSCSLGSSIVVTPCLPCCADVTP